MAVARAFEDKTNCKWHMLDGMFLFVCALGVEIYEYNIIIYDEPSRAAEREREKHSVHGKRTCEHQNERQQHQTCTIEKEH